MQRDKITRYRNANCYRMERILLNTILFIIARYVFQGSEEQNFRFEVRKNYEIMEKVSKAQKKIHIINTVSIIFHTTYDRAKWKYFS